VRGANCLSFISAFKTVKLSLRNKNGLHFYVPQFGTASQTAGFYFRNTFLIEKIIVPRLSFKSFGLKLFQIYGTWYFNKMMN
jgi:hypothetical protein